MKSLDEVIKSGITVDKDNNPIGFCLLSLRVALKAYFETLDSLGRGFGNPIDSNLNDNVDISVNTNFQIKSAETILHFHHFFELIIKHILRLKHTLLANNASDNDLIFYKLLNNESLTPEIESNLKTIEFDRTLKRFLKLLDNEILDSKYGFLREHKNTLQKLNVLRNRLWHRGLYLLDYEGLDMFCGGYLLPIIKEFIEKTDLLENTQIWKHKGLNCSLEPMEEIIIEIKDHYDITTIGFLKELGRAAYENPLRNEYFYEPLDNEHTLIASQSVDFLANYSAHKTVRLCPVCGKETLLVKNILDGGSTENEKTKVEYEVRCTLCTFSLSNRIKVPQKYESNVKIWE